MSNYHNITELINESDTEIILNLVEEGCKILSSTVVRLYFLDFNIWTLYETGVIVLIKNYNEKRYYLEFYDMNNGTKMFVEKVGKSLQYRIYEDNLHIIVSGSSCILLSLADNDEGLQFSNSMNKLIETKTKKESLEKCVTSSSTPAKIIFCKNEGNQRRFRHSKSDVGLPYNFMHVDHLGPNGFFLRDIGQEELRNYLECIDMEFLINNKEMDGPDNDHLLSSDTNFFHIKTTNTDKKFQKTKITKEDIGNPEHFVHLQHLGMNESDNFDLRTETSNMFSKDECNYENKTTIMNNEKQSGCKIVKMKITKSDISIPTNFRHLEHMGDKYIINDLDENDDENNEVKFEEDI